MKFPSIDPKTGLVIAAAMSALLLAGLDLRIQLG
jgi:hypothetical protein